jgi:hypothetical protein
MGPDRLGQLLGDREDRVQRRHRLLEDHRDAPAPDAAQLGRRRGQQILALEQDASIRDPAGRIGNQAQHRQGGDALAAAGLADDAQHLAGHHVETDAVDRGEAARVGPEHDPEVPDAEDGRRRRARTVSHAAP